MMVGFKNSSLIILLFFTLSVFSQKPKKEKKKREKSIPENIEKFSKDFSVKIRISSPQVWIDVNSRMLGQGDKFRYKPYVPAILGVALKVKKFYISAGTKLPTSEKTKKKYVDTKSRDIFINLQGRKVAWNMFYRDYNGFYLDNYAPYYPTWNLDSLGYPKRDDLHIVEAGLSLGFSFNRNFSLNAAFAQSERQKKSAGSFLMAISERYQRIDTDTDFVPPVQEAYYPNLSKLKYGNFSSTILALGYGYQVVYKNFHFTPVVMFGSGFQVQIYSQTNKNRLWINFPTYANFRGQLGYNSDVFFANVIYQMEFSSIPIKESRIRIYRNWLEFGVGVRL